MGNLLEHVEDSIASRRLLHPRQRILVAVSGGLDSMVLLHLLHALSEKNGWQLVAAHLNHRLRGRSGEADARLVRGTAKRMGLPAIIESAEVRAYAREHALSIEMGARQVRHAFLSRTAARLKMNAVALAHHADDQLELFFLRLFRGSGGEGLSGMEWRSPSPANPGLELVRPLLDMPKQALLEYASENRVSFREDESNTSLDIQRNRIRHELLPLIREHYQPALDQTVLRTMEILRADAEFVTEIAESWLKGKRQSDRPFTRPGRSVAAGAKRPEPRAASNAFEVLPVAIQRRCIQLQLLEQGVVPGFEVVEQLRQVPGKPVNLPGPGRVRALRAEDGFIEVQRGQPEAPSLTSRTVQLTGRKDKLLFDGVRLHWRIEPKMGKSRPIWGAGCEFFDADRVGSPVVLRHWRPGDRFQPIGMTQDVKLQDLFTNQRVPQVQRHRLLVAETAAGELFWIEGMRISERFKLTEGTIRRLHWGWQRL